MRMQMSIFTHWNYGGSCFLGIVAYHDIASIEIVHEYTAILVSSTSGEMVQVVRFDFQGAPHRLTSFHSCDFEAPSMR